jgi:hypothetical protein
MAERRIIQIAVVTDGNNTEREDRVYALANDGTVWCNDKGPNRWREKPADDWFALPALPQPELEPENPNGLF